MSRLFTFGCSFTRYWRWPTWADALAREYDFFENWAICGGGNSQVLYNLVECHQRHGLGPGDSVYIMWTNTSREDRYVGRRWVEGGNVYWSAGSELGEDYIRKFACERGYLIRDLAIIAAVKNLLEHWGCHWKFFSMVSLDQTNKKNHLGFNPSDLGTDDQDVRNLYRSTLDAIQPSVLDVVFNGKWDSRSGIPDSYDRRRRDFHPTPTEHLEYLDAVIPGWNTNSGTRTWMLDVQEKILAGEDPWIDRGPRERL